MSEFTCVDCPHERHFERGRRLLRRRTLRRLPFRRRAAMRSLNLSPEDEASSKRETDSRLALNAWALPIVGGRAFGAAAAGEAPGALGSAAGRLWRGAYRGRDATAAGGYPVGAPVPAKPVHGFVLGRETWAASQRGPSEQPHSAATGQFLRFVWLGSRPHCNSTGRSFVIAVLDQSFL
jgi:hypothetical protein